MEAERRANSLEWLEADTGFNESPLLSISQPRCVHAWSVRARQKENGAKLCDMSTGNLHLRPQTLTRVWIWAHTSACVPHVHWAHGGHTGQLVFSACMSVQSGKHRETERTGVTGETGVQSEAKLSSHIQYMPCTAIEAIWADYLYCFTLIHLWLLRSRFNRENSLRLRSGRTIVTADGLCWIKENLRRYGRA